MKDIASVTYIPPCWCHGSKWYNAETGEYFDPPTKPVYVRINGRRRQAKRAVWFWRLVAWVQKLG